MPILRLIGDDWSKDSKVSFSFDPNKAIKDYRTNLMKLLGLKNIREYTFWFASEDGEGPDMDRDPLNIEWKWSDYGFQANMFVYLRKSQPGDRKCDPNAKPEPPKVAAAVATPAATQASTENKEEATVIFLIGDRWIKEQKKILSLKPHDPVEKYFPMIAKKLEIEISSESAREVGGWALWPVLVNGTILKADMDRGPIDPSQTWDTYGVKHKGAVYVRQRKEGDRQVGSMADPMEALNVKAVEPKSSSEVPKASVSEPVSVNVVANQAESHPPLKPETVSLPALVPAAADVIVSPITPFGGEFKQPAVVSTTEETGSVKPMLSTQIAIQPVAVESLPAPPTIPPPSAPEDQHPTRIGEVTPEQLHMFQMMMAAGLGNSPNAHSPTRIEVAAESVPRTVKDAQTTLYENALLLARIRRLEAEIATHQAREQIRAADDLRRFELSPYRDMDSLYDPKPQMSQLLTPDPRRYPSYAADQSSSYQVLPEDLARGAEDQIAHLQDSLTRRRQQTSAAVALYEMAHFRAGRRFGYPTE